MNGIFGAGGRTRTGTVSLPVDFESTTSANSITPANVTLLLYNTELIKSSIFYSFFKNTFSALIKDVYVFVPFGLTKSKPVRLSGRPLFLQSTIQV